MFRGRLSVNGWDMYSVYAERKGGENAQSNSASYPEKQFSRGVFCLLLRSFLCKK